MEKSAEYHPLNVLLLNNSLGEGVYDELAFTICATIWLDANRCILGRM